MFELSPFRRHRNAMENFFGRDMLDFFSNDFMSPFGIDFKADIKENSKEYIVEAELPGVKKDELVVELRDNTLTISASKVSEVNAETDNYIRRERKQGKISRSFYVQNVDSAGVKSDYKDGVLKIVLPKLKETDPDSYRIKID